MKTRLIGEDGFDSVRHFLRGVFSSPTHWPEWNLVVSRHYDTRFMYFVIESGGHIHAICPVHEVRDGWRKRFHSGQFHYIPYGGWISDNHPGLSEVSYPLPVNAMIESFSLPQSGLFSTIGSVTGKCFNTMVNDLRREEEEIWSSCIDAKRRNMIRKACRCGVSVLYGTDVSDDFYELYSTAMARNGLTCLSGQFIKEMADLKGEVNFVPFVAYLNGKPSSALGLVYDKDYAIYWLGATGQESAGFGQGEFLQWEAIRFSKKHGCRYYDLCYTDRERLPRNYEFKKGFSDKEVIVPYYNHKRLLYKVLSKFSKE